MSERREHKLLKRPCFLAGLAISVLSVCGILLATGNLISLNETPEGLIAAFRAQYTNQLSAAGIPGDLIEGFIAGRGFPTNAIANLPNEQQRVISSIQMVLPSISDAVQRATEISRKKSRWGIGICSVVFFVGLGLMGWERASAKKSRTNRVTE